MSAQRVTNDGLPVGRRFGCSRVPGPCMHGSCWRRHGTMRMNTLYNQVGYSMRAMTLFKPCCRSGRGYALLQASRCCGLLDSAFQPWKSPFPACELQYLVHCSCTPWLSTVHGPIELKFPDLGDLPSNQIYYSHLTFSGCKGPHSHPQDFMFGGVIGVSVRAN